MLDREVEEENQYSTNADMHHTSEWHAMQKTSIEEKAQTMRNSKYQSSNEANHE
jgi:hypothetical protein